MQIAVTTKLRNMAASMLDLRMPNRIKIESPAQPMAENMAMTSGSMKRDLEGGNR